MSAFAIADVRVKETLKEMNWLYPTASVNEVRRRAAYDTDAARLIKEYDDAKEQRRDAELAVVWATRRGRLMSQLGMTDEQAENVLRVLGGK